MKHLLLAAVVACLAVPAWAQQQCGLRPAVVSALAEKYGEVMIARGIRQSGSLLEVYANVETGSWTVVSSPSSALSCILASGSDFEAATEARPNTDDPA